MSVYIKNLEEILKNHDKLYDKKLINFLLSNINESELVDYKFELPRIKDLVVKTNIKGLIANRLKSENKSDNAIVWNNQIKEIFPNFLNAEEYYITDKKTVKISKSGIEALKNISEYIREFNSGKLNVLTKEEENLWLNQFLKSDQENFAFYIPNIQLDFIFNIINKQNDYLLKLSAIKKSNIFVTNKNLRDFLGRISDEKRGLFIKEDSIAEIIKIYESKLYNKKDFSLSNFLTVVDSNISFNIIKGKEEFKPYEFFEKLFTYATNLNKSLILNKNRNKNFSVNSMSEIKPYNTAASNEIFNQLKIFKEVFKNKTIKLEDAENFYIAVMLTENKELYKEARNIFDFPENSNVLNFLKNKKWSGKGSFGDLDAEIFKNKLDKDLSINKELNVKKIKI
jgi:hypothetical protein